LSSELGAASPPIPKIGSSIVTVVEFTVVVVPLTIKLPLTVNTPATVTLFGKPIVNVSVADTATFTSFAVPATVSVSLPAIVCVVLPSLSIQPVDAVASTYALVAASCAAAGSVTLVILLLPALIVCEAATLNP